LEGREGERKEGKGKGRGGGGKEGGALEKCEVKPRARKAAIRPCIDCFIYVGRGLQIWPTQNVWRGAPYEIKDMCQADKKRM